MKHLLISLIMLLSTTFWDGQAEANCPPEMVSPEPGQHHYHYSVTKTVFQVWQAVLSGGRIPTGGTPEPLEQGVIVMPDSDPDKKDSFLAVPMNLQPPGAAQRIVANLSDSERRSLIETAVNVCGKHPEWAPFGLAQNSTTTRSQCQIHLHIAQLDPKRKPGEGTGFVDGHFSSAHLAGVQQYLDQSWLIHSVPGESNIYHFHALSDSGESYLLELQPKKK